MEINDCKICSKEINKAIKIIKENKINNIKKIIIKSSNSEILVEIPIYDWEDVSYDELRYVKNYGYMSRFRGQGFTESDDKDKYFTSCNSFFAIPLVDKDKKEDVLVLHLFYDKNNLIAEVITEVENGLDYDEGLKKAYIIIYKSKNPQFNAEETFSVDSCYRDIPAVDSILFTYARKHLHEAVSRRELK